MKISFATEQPSTRVAAPSLPAHRWRPRTRPNDKIRRTRAHLKRLDETQGRAVSKETAREICRRDIFYLAHEVLGYKDLDHLLHDDLCDFLVDAERRGVSTVTMVPRSHFKSTLATITRSIWWMINDPNVTIGLVSGSLKNSKKFLREIRNQLEKCETLKSLFPEIFYGSPQNESPKWTESEIVIRRTATVKEPTIKCFGLLEGLPTGDHYDKLLVDDAVDQEVVKTEKQLEKILSQIKYLRPLRKRLDQPIHWVGTRYHVRDPYGPMLDDPTNSVYIRLAIENGKPIFAAWYTPESLEVERQKLGTFVFNCQYMMQPGDPAEQKFKSEWIHKRAPISKDAPGYFHFLIVDPANAQKKESDFTAMSLISVDWEMKLQYTDGVHDKLNPRQRIEAVLDLYEKWKFEVCGYETVGFQQTDAFWLRQRMEKRNIHFRIHEINNKKQSKTDRIIGMQPMFEAGQFFFPDEPIHYKRKWVSPDDGYGRVVDLVEQARAQLDFFPHGAFDDILDTFQMSREIVFAPWFEVPQKPEPPRGAYGRRRGNKPFKVAAH